MRRFTFLHLEIRRLSLEDIFFILIYTALVVWAYISFSNDKTRFGLLLVIVFTNSYFTAATHFGLRLNSLYFSLIWMALCVATAIRYQTIFAAVPLMSFFTYQVIRCAFWNKYDREFIPFDTGRGVLYRYRSTIERRVGGPKDKDAMRILIALIVIEFMVCLATLVGKKIQGN